MPRTIFAVFCLLVYEALAGPVAHPSLNKVSATPAFKRSEFSFKSVPSCAQDCFSNFVKTNFPTSLCSKEDDIACLCTYNGENGFTLGEGAYTCMATECDGVPNSSLVAAYNMCLGIKGAARETHHSITAGFKAVMTGTSEHPKDLGLGPHQQAVSTTSRKIHASATSATQTDSSASASSTLPTFAEIPATSAVSPSASPVASLKKGQITGIAVACSLIAITAAALLLYLFWTKRRQNVEFHDDESGFIAEHNVQGKYYHEVGNRPNMRLGFAQAQGGGLPAGPAQKRWTLWNYAKGRYGETEKPSGKCASDSDWSGSSVGYQQEELPPPVPEKPPGYVVPSAPPKAHLASTYAVPANHTSPSELPASLQADPYGHARKYSQTVEAQNAKRLSDPFVEKSEDSLKMTTFVMDYHNSPRHELFQAYQQFSTPREGVDQLKSPEQPYPYANREEPYQQTYQPYRGREQPTHNASRQQLDQAPPIPQLASPARIGEGYRNSAKSAKQTFQLMRTEASPHAQGRLQPEAGKRASRTKQARQMPPGSRDPHFSIYSNASETDIEDGEDDVLETGVLPSPMLSTARRQSGKMAVSKQVWYPAVPSPAASSYTRVVRDNSPPKPSFTQTAKATSKSMPTTPSRPTPLRTQFNSPSRKLPAISTQIELPSRNSPHKQLHPSHSNESMEANNRWQIECSPGLHGQIEIYGSPVSPMEVTPIAMSPQALSPEAMVTNGMTFQMMAPPSAAPSWNQRHQFQPRVSSRKPQHLARPAQMPPAELPGGWL